MTHTRTTGLPPLLSLRDPSKGSSRNPGTCNKILFTRRKLADVSCKTRKNQDQLKLPIVSFGVGSRNFAVASPSRDSYFSEVDPTASVREIKKLEIQAVAFGGYPFYNHFTGRIRTIFLDHNASNKRTIRRYSKRSEHRCAIVIKN